MVKPLTIKRFKHDIAYLSNLTRKQSKNLATALTSSSNIAQQLGDMRLAELLDKANIKFQEFLNSLKEVEEYAKQ